MSVLFLRLFLGIPYIINCFDRIFSEKMNFDLKVKPQEIETKSE